MTHERWPLPAYDYRCQAHGVIEVSTRMGEAPARVACPTCGQDARRVYGAPLLAWTPGALARLREREERSRDQPDTVTRQLAPSRSRQVADPDPRRRQLPR